MAKKFLLLALLSGAFISIACIKTMNQYYNGPSSDHFNGQQFYNIASSIPQRTFFDFLKWRLTGSRGDWPNNVDNVFNDVPPEKIPTHDIRISWVGHVTFLIQTCGMNILTDPVWSNRIGPFGLVGPIRVSKPGIDFQHLPKIDVILVSHNHYDHLDLATLKKLWHRDKPRMITPLGNETIIKSIDASMPITTQDWGDSTKLNDQLMIACEPAHHWSARGIFDRNKALWATFIIQTPQGNICFVGDSGYGNGSHFKNIGKKYKNVKVALLPMGAFKPRWFMEYSHMDPKDMTQATKDLNADYCIPSHYNTFPLADDSYDEALNELKVHIQSQKDGLSRFKLLKIGEHWILPDIAKDKP